MRVRGLAGCVAVLAAMLVAGGVHAHDVASRPVRELIRIQGYRSPAPTNVQASRELTLTVLGKPLPFASTDWQSFRFGESNASPTPSARTTVGLQGARPLLSRINSARPDQQITILAERRPGARDAFVLTVDLCPP